LEAAELQVAPVRYCIRSSCWNCT